MDLKSNENKTHYLKFRAINRDIFEAIKNGAKKIETRAATKRFRDIKVGDKVKLICGKDKFEKEVKKSQIYKTITAMLRKYKPNEINPKCSTAKELREMYYSFQSYRKKIKNFGLIVLELKQPTNIISRHAMS